MDTLDKLGSIILYIMLVVVIMALLLGLPVMLLWNWLMPTLFGLTTVTFWQAVGLNLLSGLLFKSSSSSK